MSERPHPRPRIEGAAFEAHYAALRERFELEHGEPARELRADLSGVPAGEVRRRVIATIPPGSSDLLVLWPAERAAVWIDPDAFARQLVDAWAPGADDILITDQSLSWLIVLDHEQRLWRFDG